MSALSMEGPCCIRWRASVISACKLMRASVYASMVLQMGMHERRGPSDQPFLIDKKEDTNDRATSAGWATCGMSHKRWSRVGRGDQEFRVRTSERPCVLRVRELE